jgi:hypothetical protein
MRSKFSRLGEPVIAVDTKKKELVGPFKNAGAAWNRTPVLVAKQARLSVHDLWPFDFGTQDIGEG